MPGLQLLQFLNYQGKINRGEGGEGVKKIRITILLADVFEKFKEMCLNFYRLDPAKVLSPPRLAWQAAFKKTKVKLDILTDIDMFLMVEKDIRGGICNPIHQYAKANNKYMKDYHKKKNHHILIIGM